MSIGDVNYSSDVRRVESEIEFEKQSPFIIALSKIQVYQEDCYYAQSMENFNLKQDSKEQLIQEYNKNLSDTHEDSQEESENESSDKSFKKGRKVSPIKSHAVLLKEKKLNNQKAKMKAQNIQLKISSAKLVVKRVHS